jgi:hypothetical protein
MKRSSRRWKLFATQSSLPCTRDLLEPQVVDQQKIPRMTLKMNSENLSASFYPCWKARASDEDVG